MLLSVSLVLTYQSDLTPSEAHEAVHAAADAFADALSEHLEDDTGHSFGVHEVKATLDRSRRTTDGFRVDGTEGTYTVTVTATVPRRALEAIRHTAGVYLAVREQAINLLDYLCEQAEHYGGGCVTYPATVCVTS
jgi:hypothetical protein